MTEVIKKLENIASSNAPKGIKLIRSLAISIPKKKKTITRSDIEKQIDREYSKVIRRSNKKSKLVDNYINESVSESTDTKTGFNTIKKLLDESHGDIRKYLNENKIKKYKTTADGLLITFDSGVTILMECIVGNRKKYTLKQGKEVLLITIVNSPYTIPTKTNSN